MPTNKEIPLCPPVQQPESLIDEQRLDKITEVGLVDGGVFADVLAVSYGEEDTKIRLRYELSGNRFLVVPPHGMSLEQSLERIATVLSEAFPYRSTPEVVMLRGRNARRWVRRFIARAIKATKELEKNGGVSQDRLTVVMPCE